MFANPPPTSGRGLRLPFCSLHAAARRSALAPLGSLQAGCVGSYPNPRALWGWARPQNVLVAPCHPAQSSVCPGGPATGLSAPVMDALRQEAPGQAAGEGAAARARLKRAGGCCRLSAGRSREGLISRALNQCQSEQRRWGATSAPLRRGRQPRRSSFCELRRAAAGALRPALPSRGWRIWAVRPGMSAHGSRGTFGDGCRGQQLCALLTASPS